MKSKILIFSLFVIMGSCSSQDSRVRENILLSEKVEVAYLETLDHGSNPSEWLFGLDKERLLKTIFDQVLNSNVDVYINTQSYFKDEVLPVENFSEHLPWVEGELNYNELSKIMFSENWCVPDNLKSFSKEVIFYSPVKVWKRDPDSDETLMIKLFHVKNSSNKKGELIAKSIFMEFDLTSSDYFPRWDGFSPNRFLDHVQEGLLKEKIDIYDPIYIVDKSVIPISVDEIEEAIGGTLSEHVLRNEVSSLIFEENWYIDSESLSIQKEVLSVGFVRDYWDAESGHKTKILFFLRFE